MTDWIVKRGVLYALTQMPMTTLMVSYYWRWTDYATATAFGVILGFLFIPIWISIRRARSDDPDEPAHHFTRYALYALVPYVVYNIARVPMNLTVGQVFWDHWYDFGYELTGNRVDQWDSFIPGTLLHSLQGYVLALGFFILFKRHSLMNALAYVWVTLSAVYVWVYPYYVLVDFQPPLRWFFLAWWAHFWMALAAWYTPRLYAGALWERLGAFARTALLVVAVGLYVFPVTYVSVRVATWQFPQQKTIDEASFEKIQLKLQGRPTLTSLGPATFAADRAGGNGSAEEARYRFDLRIGPRIYLDYIHAQKAVDAGPIKVSGTLARGGNVIAWCSAYIEEIETPNNITRPKPYFRALKRMEYTDIPVDCVGPSEEGEALTTGGSSSQVQLNWIADVHLIGDREEKDVKIRGREKGVSVSRKFQ